MINFDNWFTSIIAYSDLIASPYPLKKAWVQQDDAITSAYDFGELAEQVLGDLDLEGQIKRFSKELENKNALAAFLAFSHAFQNVDQLTTENSAPLDPSALLNSDAWLSLRDSARSIIGLPSAAPYRNGETGSHFNL